MREPRGRGRGGGPEGDLTADRRPLPGPADLLVADLSVERETQGLDLIEAVDAVLPGDLAADAVAGFAGKAAKKRIKSSAAGRCDRTS
jgi:hypothetical protein